MTVPIFYWFSKPKTPQATPNHYGEVALPFAPKVKLENGSYAVPQQYLDVVRTLDNLEAVLSQISVPDHFQLFAGQEGSVLFLIVAVVGKENYPAASELSNQDKIVYGRRWLIEETTPTSEVVQTALLAIQKVREHELREKVSVTINAGANSTTPFNNHLDLPLFAGNANSLLGKHSLSFEQQCDRLSLDGLKVVVKSEHRVANQFVIEVIIEGDSAQFKDLCNTPIIISVADRECFAHEFMQALISMSNRSIEEIVRFEGCARFSQKFNVFDVAEFNYLTRNIKSDDARFKSAFQDMSYRVDAAKAPPISENELGDQQRQFLANYQNLTGYLPID